MNGDAQRFKALLQEIFVPSVCVTYTPDAQQLLHDCYGSSSFARLCEPWCLTNRKATVHTLAENVGIELSDFAIRLVDLNDVEKSEDELDAQLANKVASTASEDAYANFKLHHRADLPAFLKGTRAHT